MKALRVIGLVLACSAFQLGCRSAILVLYPPEAIVGPAAGPVIVLMDGSRAGRQTVISGNVFDLYTLKPVETAFVYFESREFELAVTDAEGHFAFAVPKRSSWLREFRISVRKGGYSTYSEVFSDSVSGPIYLERKAGRSTLPMD